LLRYSQTRGGILAAHGGNLHEQSAREGQCKSVILPVNSGGQHGGDIAQRRKNEVLPRGNKVLPCGNEALLRGNKVFPRGNKVFPRSNEVLPCGNEVLPRSNEVFPHGNEVLLHGYKVFPHGNEVLLHGYKAFPRGKNIREIQKFKTEIQKFNRNIQKFKTEIQKFNRKNRKYMDCFVPRNDGAVNIQKSEIENRNVQLFSYPVIQFIIFLSNIKKFNNMIATKWIPPKQVEFCGWATNIIGYADENHTRWLVAAPDADLKARLETLKALVNKCLLPTRSKVDTREKNEMKKSVEKDLRDYLQGMVVRNVNVTNRDRELMGLPIYDTTPTAVGDPQGQPTASIVYLGGQVLEMRISHVEGSPFDMKANYGKAIHMKLCAEHETPPETADELPKSKFTRRKKEIFKFAQSDIRKTAYFCIRYENSKGVAGPWGPMITAVIP
jgi:hypothetical protein